MRALVMSPDRGHFVRRMFAVAMLTCGVLTAGMPVTSAATPQRVLDGRYPRGVALALEPSGHRHIVAAGRAGDLWYATDRSGAWTSQRILLGEPGSFAWTEPAIATDEDGSVHVVAVHDAVYDTPSSTAGIFYTTDKGRARGDFRPRVQVAPAMMTAPSLRVEDGVRYLAYARRPFEIDEDGAPVFFKTDRGGTWHVERIAGFGSEPSLRVDAAGRARIVYADRHGLRITRSLTPLGDFTAPDRIPGTRGLPGEASLAIGPGGREQIVWISGPIEPRARYIRRTATGWTAPKRLTQTIEAAISIDALGDPHIVLGGPRIRHHWARDGEWQHRILARTYASGVDIRAFGKGASIVWAQDTAPRGVWIVRA